MNHSHRIVQMNEAQRFAALDHWFNSPQGQDVSCAFSDQLTAFKMPWLGKYLLQLGDCGKNSWLDNIPCTHKWILSPAISIKKRTIVSAMSAIPLERESIDCIMAPLTLEFTEPHTPILDEIDRVLKPMGYLIFLGVNPWSFWGISLRWGRLSCFAHVSSSFSSSLLIKHAMISRGYAQCGLASFYYLPPIGSEYWLRKLEFLNQMSKMIWPYPAGFYCLILQKQDPCMTSLSCTIEHEWLLA